MKTAISVPDALFEHVERQLGELGMSRSEFYATAARRYLEELAAQSLTAEIDAALEALRAEPETRAEMDRERTELTDYAQRRFEQLTDGDDW